MTKYQTWVMEKKSSASKKELCFIESMLDLSQFVSHPFRLTYANNTQSTVYGAGTATLLQTEFTKLKMYINPKKQNKTEWPSFQVT